VSDGPLGLRRDYALGELDESSLAADPFEQFRLWLDEAADQPEPNAMVVGTVDADGLPSSRTVLLRGLEGGFRFFSHRDSAKGLALAHLAEASALFPWYALQRQVIIAGHVEQLSDADSDAYWLTRPWASQVSARASHQSRPIASREALEAAMAAEQAAHPQGTDVPRPAEWGGYVIVPRRIEFWQGRRSRLHDRLVYTRAGGDWAVTRLQP
jgi:pyridoxamine 5'-phosphate oxidase